MKDQYGAKISKFYITTTSGMRGMFPVKIVVYEDGFQEPWETGITCKDFEECQKEAMNWAKAENMEYVP
jgi:hypothetical protein